MRLADFGQSLRKYRLAHKLTQEQMGDLLGVQSKHVSFLENGRRNPGPELQKKLEDLIMADELGKAFAGEERVITREETEVLIRLYHKLCKLKPPQREQALELIYQILDAMARGRN